jgi:hypothetical protein
VLSQEERFWRFGGVVAAGIALVAAFVWTPEAFPLPSCLFRDLTGMSCFTCGLTRSLHAMAHGDLAGAARFHLMGPPLFAFVIVGAGIWTIEAVRGRTIPLRRGAVRTVLVSGGLFWVGYWVTRFIVELS